MASSGNLSSDLTAPSKRKLNIEQRYYNKDTIMVKSSSANIFLQFDARTPIFETVFCAS